MYRSKDYLLWISEAEALFLGQKRGTIKMLCGSFVARLELFTLDKRRRKDGDNRWKAPLDFFTRMGLIEDDKYCEKGLFLWKTEPFNESGCRLTIWSLDDPNCPQWE